MKKTFVFLSLASFLYACANKKEAADQTPAVTVWENTNFAGKDTSFIETTNYVGYIWNDRISSFKLKKGYTATFYDDANFSGVNVALKGPVEYNCNEETNDRFSSVKIVKDAE